MLKASTLFNRAFSRLAGHQGFRRYLLNTSWMFAEQVLRLIAGLFVGIYMARYLGPEQFGIYSYAAAFVALFGTIARLGLDGIVVRELVNRPEQRDVYLGTAFWLKLTAAFLTIVLLAIAVKITSNDATTNLYILIIACGLVFQSFDVVDFYFQSRVLSKYVSISKLIQLALSSLLKLYFIFIEAELLWFVIVSFIDQATLALSLIASYFLQKLGRFLGHFDSGIAKAMLRNSWPLILSGIAISLYTRINQIMIKEMLGEREVGLFSAAMRLSEAWYFLPVIITTSLLPAILNAKNVSPILYNTRLQQLYTGIIYMTLGVAIPTTLLSENIMTSIYGASYKDASSVLATHIWCGIFVAIGVVNNSWFLAENFQKFATANMLIGATVNAASNYFLIPIYGIEGAAFSTLFAQCVSSYLALFLWKETRAQFYRITFSAVPQSRKRF